MELFLKVVKDQSCRQVSSHLDSLEEFIYTFLSVIQNNFNKNVRFGRLALKNLSLHLLFTVSKTLLRTSPLVALKSFNQRGRF